MKLRTSLPKIWPAVASAMLVVACFPPFRLILLVFVALVPLLLYLRECDGKRAFRAGYLFGFVFWLGELSFIASFVGKWTQSSALGLIPYLIGCLIASFYFALFAWLANLCYRNSLTWAVPIVWAGVEVFRSYIVALAFPYGLLAMPLTPLTPIIQSAHYGSIYLVSAWIVLANVIVAEVMAGRRFQPMRWYTVAVLLVLIVSLLRFTAHESGEAKTVVAGQPGIDVAFGGEQNLPARLAVEIDQIMAASKGADLLVLPEGVIKAGTQMPPHVLFELDPKLPTVFGGQRGGKPIYQSAFGYDGDWTFADKTRLVIFGEYVPFREHLPLGSFQLPGEDLIPADDVTSLKVGPFLVGGAICFEGLFPDVTYRHALNGANILAIMSVDDWYIGTNAPEQLRDAANWRAIEAGLPVIRSASMGYTIIADARGRIVAEAPMGSRQALRTVIRVPDGPDLFPLFPVFPYLSLAFLIGVPVYDFVRRRKAPS